MAAAVSSQLVSMPSTVGDMSVPAITMGLSIISQRLD
jgi:hypothetical protein